MLFRSTHLGNLPEWRPIDPLLTGLASLDSVPDLPPLRVEFYGYLYPRAHELIERLNPTLARHQLSIHNSVGHLDSHRVAAESDILLVMIGLRHVDNQPSKFFVYLGHKKPVLIVGPAGNPIQKIVEDLGIGVYADVRSNTSIRDGIQELAKNYKAYQQAFEKQHQKLKLYGADEVAANLMAVLDQTLANTKFA